VHVSKICRWKQMEEGRAEKAEEAKGAEGVIGSGQWA